MTHQDWMKIAFEEGFKGMQNNLGGPFGAIVVLDGKVIGRGCNRVTSQNDPTAHAEVTAIREACKAVGNFHLKGAVIYTSCEPCPMCLAAIYWANLDAIYYCSTRSDAKAIGFDDEYIYDELNKPVSERGIACRKLEVPEGDALFNAWCNKQDRVPY